MNGNKKIYEQIEWHIANNGSMDPNRYLDRQVARAICSAAYRNPVTIDEISAATGIPCLYIEDELDNLLYGEAIEMNGGKVQTSFIIHTSEMNEFVHNEIAALCEDVGDKIYNALKEKDTEIRSIGFIGNDMPATDLWWVLLPLVARSVTSYARAFINRLMQQSQFPLRKDGGRGWFVVNEKGQKDIFEFAAGCNSCDDADNANGKRNIYFNYYWTGKYFDHPLYNHLCSLPKQIYKGRILELSQLDPVILAEMIKFNIMKKAGSNYRWAIPVFTTEQEEKLNAIVGLISRGISEGNIGISKAMSSIYDNYKQNVPERLHNQIIGVIGSQFNIIVGLVGEVFVKKGYLSKLVGDEHFAARQVMMIHR